MPLVHIECPSCRWEGRVDESLVGRQLKCKKCGSSFRAEIGGSYDMEAEPEPEPPPRPRAAPEPTTGPARRAPRNKPIRGSKPMDPDLEKMLDQWSDE